MSVLETVGLGLVLVGLSVLLFFGGIGLILLFARTMKESGMSDEEVVNAIQEAAIEDAARNRLH